MRDYIRNSVSEALFAILDTARHVDDVH